MPQTIVIAAINLRVGASWDLTDAGVLIITFSNNKKAVKTE